MCDHRTSLSYHVRRWHDYFLQGHCLDLEEMNSAKIYLYILILRCYNSNKYSARVFWQGVTFVQWMQLLHGPDLCTPQLVSLPSYSQRCVFFPAFLLRSFHVCAMHVLFFPTVSLKSLCTYDRSCLSVKYCFTSIVTSLAAATETLGRKLHVLHAKYQVGNQWLY